MTLERFKELIESHARLQLVNKDRYDIDQAQIDNEIEKAIDVLFQFTEFVRKY